MRTRSRSSSVPHMYLGVKYMGRGEPYGQSYYYLDNSYDLPLVTQTTSDELHAGPPFLSGGPFNSRKWDITPITTLANVGQYGNGPDPFYHYDGGFVTPLAAVWKHLWLDWCSSDSEDDVRDKGAEAWNRFKPAQPKASAAQFLAELRETPRMLMTSADNYVRAYKSFKGRKTRRPWGKHASNEWVNYCFGWLPFVHDLRDFYKTTKNLDTYLDQIQRDNGHWIYRSGPVSSDEESVIVSQSDTSHVHYPTLNTYFYKDGLAPGHHVMTRTTSFDCWFAARFRYFIPDCGTWRWRKRAVAQLFGLYPSPELIWELTPWSWLADWCSNIGDVLANLNNHAAENLAAKYAYIMGTHTRSLSVDSTMELWDGPRSAQWLFNATQKSRVVANPFGFAMDDWTPTAYQMSILGALGLSRLM